jgi:hypothetical protein
MLDGALETLTLEEMGRTLCAALDDDAGVSGQAIGLLAKYLHYRVDGNTWRVTLEDVSGLDEDQEAIAELLDAGMLAVVLPRTDTDFETVVLSTDQQATEAARVEDAIAYLNGFYDIENTTADTTDDTRHGTGEEDL